MISRNSPVKPAAAALAWWLAAYSLLPRCSVPGPCFGPLGPINRWSLGAALLVVAGLAMVASVTAGVLLIDLAEEWTARGAVINDGVWASAHHVAKIHEGLGFTSAFFLIGSLAVFGGLISAKGAVPRWVGWIGAASGLALGLALIGSAAGEAPFWWTFVASARLFPYQPAN